MKDGSTILYEPLAINNYGQVTSHKRSNGLINTSIDYDQYGIIDKISAGDKTIFDMTFDINIKNGNLNYRRDDREGITPILETFMYDEHYRIKSSTIGSYVMDMGYDPNGNITKKSDISPLDMAYEYDPNKIHAVNKIKETLTVSSNPQSIDYDSAEQPTRIVEGGYQLDLVYGADRQRRRTTLSNGSTIYDRYFIGSYEHDIQNSIERDIHYLGGGVIAVKENGVVEYFYTYSDYLNSILAVTDASGQVVARQSYDAWGRERDVDDWISNDPQSSSLPWLYRGNTGHEMLPDFDLINMNGRIYDPLIARMLQPDSYAGKDGTTQSYNRYSYVQNNPMMYTDPSGEIGCYAFGAAIGLSFAKKMTIGAIGNVAGQMLSSGINSPGGSSMPSFGSSRSPDDFILYLVVEKGQDDIDMIAKYTQSMLDDNGVNLTVQVLEVSSKGLPDGYQKKLDGTDALAFVGSKGFVDSMEGGSENISGGFTDDDGIGYVNREGIERRAFTHGANELKSVARTILHEAVGHNFTGNGNSVGKGHTNYEGFINMRYNNKYVNSKHPEYNNIMTAGDAGSLDLNDPNAYKFVKEDLERIRAKVPNSVVPIIIDGIKINKCYDNVITTDNFTKRLKIRP